MTKKQKNKIRIMLWHLAMIMVAIFMLPINVDASEPEKPAELENRTSKNHVFEYTKNPDGDNGSYEYGMTDNNTLIMPGDTFTFKVYKSDTGNGEDDFYYSLGYWDSNKQKPYEACFDGDGSDYSFGGDVTAATAVEVTETATITKKGDNAETYDVPVSFKNNSSYPIIIGLNMSGSAGQNGQSYQTSGLTVKFIKPYYNITYSFGESDDLFWPLGEYENLDFPKYYWITDEQYTINIPNPVKEGAHFKRWNQTVDKYYKKDGGNYSSQITVKWDISDDTVGINSSCFQSYRDVDISPEWDENGATIVFYGNKGKVNDRDKWVLEVSKKDDTNSENPVYDFNLDNTTGNAIATRDDDTFLGWCTKESALYNFDYNDDRKSGSFVTADSAADAYEALSLSEDGGSPSNNWSKGALYAKWASETNEALEKNGYVLQEGTLWFLNNFGVRAWIDARTADGSLPAKVTDIKTGYKDEKVTSISDGLENCTGLTKLTVSDLSLTCSFKGCSNLKKINLDPGDYHYSETLGYEQFEGTSPDLVINVPEDQLGYYRDRYPDYSYLFNADTSDRRYPLTVNGEIITDNNLTVACGKGTAVFDPDTSTLTLENAELSKCINLHNVSARYWNGDYHAPYDEAVIVSNLSALKIILKGTNVVKRTEDYLLRDLVRAYGDVEITGDGSIEGNLVSSHYFIQDDSGKSVPYDGICKLPITAFGNVTIDGITAKRLIVSPAKNLVINNADFEGGQFSSGTGVTITNVKIEQDKETGGPDGIMETTVGGKSLVVDKCVFNYVTVDTDENTESISFKNSNIQLQSRSSAEVTISGGDNTALVIDNSTFNAYGKTKGVTNIPESKINLTKCAITRGAWNESGYFIIEPAEPETYTITFNTGGGSAVDSQTVIYGNAANKPKDPVKNGYTFDGWYSDSALSKTFDFTIKITENITVYAKWKENMPSSGGSDKDAGDTAGGDGKTDTTTPTDGSISGGSGNETGGDGKTDTTTPTDDSISGGDKESGSQEIKTPAVGTIEEDSTGTATYKVTETSKDSNGKTVVEVTYTAPTAAESNKTSVTVPATTTLKDGTVAEVTEIAANAFKNNKRITKVTVGKNVRKIGNRAFYGCSKLKIANLGSNVTTIDSNAFAKCTVLTKITIPKSTKSIGARAFDGDKKLKTITIKSTKLTSKTIAKNAFKGITTKTTIKVPKSKKKAYTTLFRKKGLSKKVKIK